MQSVASGGSPQGYLVYPYPILPTAKFDALKAHFEQKLANLAADVRPETMDVPHFTDPTLFEWLFADDQPNHASLHDGRLMHESDANTSAKRRCGYTMRYVSTATKLSGDRLSYHHFYLARGKERSGNQYGDPSKSYEHLARYREKHNKGGH